jgi:hypothetical protein
MLARTTQGVWQLVVYDCKGSAGEGGRRSEDTFQEPFQAAATASQEKSDEVNDGNNKKSRAYKCGSSRIMRCPAACAATGRVAELATITEADTTSAVYQLFVKQTYNAPVK